MRKVILWLCATPISLSIFWVVSNIVLLLGPASLFFGAEFGDPRTLVLAMAFSVPFFACLALTYVGVLDPSDIEFIFRACVWQTLGFFVGFVWGFFLVLLCGAILTALKAIPDGSQDVS